MKNLIEKTRESRYDVPVIEVEGDLGLEFTDDLMEVLDLSVGDKLQFQPEPTKGNFLVKVIKA